jgi:hypothetical protein
MLLAASPGLCVHTYIHAMYARQRQAFMHLVLMASLRRRSGSIWLTTALHHEHRSDGTRLYGGLTNTKLCV